MKQLTAILLCGLLALSLAACGGASGNSGATASASSAAVQEVPAAEEDMEMTVEATEGSLGADGQWQLPADRKIIKDMQITMETKTFDDTLEGVNALLEEQGGYVESSYQSNGSWDGGGSRYASITARIPAQALDGTAEALAQLGHVTDQSQQARDITDQYYDADARLASLQTQEDRLLELLSQAGTLEDMITLEEALSQVRYEIESLTAQLRRYDSQVAYSTLNLEILEVSDLSVVRSTPVSFGQKAANAAQDSLRLVLEVGQFLILTLITLLPLLVVVLVVVLVVLAIVRAVRRRRRKTPTPAPWQGKQPPSEPPAPPSQP